MNRWERKTAQWWLLPGAITVLLSLAGLGAVVLADQDWAWRVVDRSVRAAREVRYEGSRDVVLFRNSQKVAGFRQRLARDVGGRERVTVLEPPDQRGRTEVCDGQTRWEYYPRARKVIISSMPARPPLKPGGKPPGPRASGRLNAAYLGDAQVAGRLVHIIELTNPAGRPACKLWIDHQKFVQLKVQRFDPSGNVTYSAYFTRISYDPQFPPGLFSFTIPPDTTIVRVPAALPRMMLEQAEQQAGFKAKLPPYLPPGFVLEHDRAAVARMKRQAVLWLSFSNGVDRFSLFQGPRRLPMNPGHSKLGECWMMGAFRFVLGGSLPPEEVQKIKDSLQK